jgi:metabolite-proton symporter
VSAAEAAAAAAGSSGVRKPPSIALRRRVIAASAIGTTVEWYDFLLYGTAAALVFGKVFFPRSDPLTGTMLAFATYGVGFLARPFGGVVFGHFGDRIGRKRLLMLSMLMMGIATFLIGVLPTFNQVGVAAPAMLIGLRLVQGFGLGGQWGGAILMSAEYGDAKRRGLWTGITQAGGGLGNFLATAVLAVLAATLSQADFLAWGWRIQFLLSVVLIGIGIWVRVSLAESPVFEEALEKAEEGAHAAPVLETLRRMPGRVVLGGALKFGENISFYLMTAFAITYVTEMLHLSRSVALNGVLAGALVATISMPLWAWLSDRIGRRPVYGFGAAGLAIWAFAFYPMLDTRSPGLIMLAIVIGLLVHSAMNGPQGAVISELFPTRIRYSGASLCYQVTSIVGGSWAPIISLALFKQFHSTVPISIYLAGSCAVSLIATILARETRGLTFAQIDAEDLASRPSRPATSPELPAA